jgi:hypothetical protein
MLSNYMRPWLLLHRQCLLPSRALRIRFYLHRHSMHRFRHRWLFESNRCLHFIIGQRHSCHMVLSIQLRIFFRRIVSDHISRVNSFDQNVFAICPNEHFGFNYLALGDDLEIVNAWFFIGRNIAELDIMHNCWFRVIHQNHCYIVPNCIFRWFKDNIVVDCWILVSNLDFVQKCVIFKRNTHIVDCRWVGTFAFRSR